MVDIVEELKDKARVLHASVKRQDAAGVARLRTLPELKSLDETALLEQVQRKHCLAVIARELGFSGWSHAVAILEGRPSEDMGTLLSPPGAAAHWNIWSAHYEEARSIRAEHGGYLLAYKRHFFVVDRSLHRDPGSRSGRRSMGTDGAGLGSARRRDRTSRAVRRAHSPAPVSLTFPEGWSGQRGTPRVQLRPWGRAAVRAFAVHNRNEFGSAHCCASIVRLVHAPSMQR